MNTTTDPRNIAKTHCQQCGSTDEESVGWDARRENDGYTACCNELARGEAYDYMNRLIKCSAETCSHE